MSMNTLASLNADLRYAFRNLSRNPAFTAVAVGALAIGIGANTAVFTVVESVLLRPLPYHEPARLYTVRPVTKRPTPFDMGSMSDPLFIACRSASTAFQQLAAYNFLTWNGTGAGDPVVIHGEAAEPRFQTRVLASFSSIAFLLAIVGIYGVMAYSVTQRTEEIGIRMAIGAERRHIVQMILWRSAALVMGGLAIGLAGAWAATRVLKNFLFEVTPFDPLTFAAVSLLLALVALAACYLPARRAAAIDPLVALRYE
jgi:ABC-type lipoprotein release transport system permease subunit